MRHELRMPDLLPSVTDARLTDALSGRIGPAMRGDYVATALADAVAGMQPGWIVLQGCTLDPGDAPPSARIRYALLHQQVGIALLDFVPGDTTLNAAKRLGRLLDAAGFTARFGGHPPIVYLCMPTRTLPSLGWVLDQEFGRQPPLALPHGGTWVGVAQRVLAAERLPDLPERTAAEGAAGGGHPTSVAPHGRQRAAGRRRRGPGMRLLTGGWGLLALALGGGTVVLHHLGPPEEPAVTTAGGPGPAPGPKEARLAANMEGYPPATEPPPPLPISSPNSAESVLPAADMRRSDPVARAMDGAEDIGSHAGPGVPEPAETAPPEVQGSVSVAAVAGAPDFLPASPASVPTSADSDGAGVMMAGIAAPLMAPQAGTPFTENTGNADTQAQVAIAVASAPDLPGPPAPAQAEDASRTDLEPLPAEGNAAPSPPSSDLPVPVVAPPPPRAGATAAGPDPAIAPADIAAAPGGDTAPIEAEPLTVAPGAPEEGAPSGTAPSGAVAVPEPVGAATGMRSGSSSAAPVSEAVGPGIPSAEAMHGEGTSAAADARTSGPRASAEAEANSAPQDRAIPVTEDDVGAAASPAAAPFLATTTSSTARTAVSSTSAPNEARSTAGNQSGTGAAPQHAPAGRDGGGSDLQRRSETSERDATRSARTPEAMPRAPTGPAAPDRAASDMAAPVPDRQADRPLPPAPAVVVLPVREPQATPVARSLSPSMLEMLIRRGDEMIRLGDISAARLLYERAAAAGSGQAAIAMGRTYDPAFLATLRVRGIQGDPAIAVTWYRRALALGAGEARERLARFGIGQDK